MSTIRTARASAPKSAAHPARAPFAAAAALAAAAIAIALLTQHRFGMEPCPWCIVQRVLLIAAGLAAATAAWAGRGTAARAGAGIAIVAALAGLAAAVWQQGWASQSLSCARTLADRLLQASGLPQWWPAMFEATASCADANQPLLGLPYAAWSGAAFVLVASLAAVGWQRAGSRRAG
jgi:disulfide bond formation protein DsbB